MLDEFEANIKKGLFQYVVHPPSRYLYQFVQEDLPNQALPIILLKPLLKHIFIALDLIRTAETQVDTQR